MWDQSWSNISWGNHGSAFEEMDFNHLHVLAGPSIVKYRLFGGVPLSLPSICYVPVRMWSYFLPICRNLVENLSFYSSSSFLYRIHVHQMHTLHGDGGFYHWLMWFNFNKLRAGREFYAWWWWVCHWLMWFYFSSKLRADGEFYAVILLSLSCFIFGTPACLSLLYREVTLHQLYYGQYRPDWDLQDARIWSFNRVLRGLD
jgi:hypothetical protein